jgi:hypothetical protein
MASRSEAALQVLELPAPFEPGAGRQGHRFHLWHGLPHERTHVSTAHVGLNDDPPLSILAADLVQTFGEPELCDLA